MKYEVCIRDWIALPVFRPLLYHSLCKQILCVVEGEGDWLCINESRNVLSKYSHLPHLLSG